MFLWTGTWDLDMEEKSEMTVKTKVSKLSEKTKWNRNSDHVIPGVPTQGSSGCSQQPDVDETTQEQIDT